MTVAVEAQLALYSAVAQSRQLTFRFGVSQFLPTSALTASAPFGYTDSGSHVIVQPGEVYVRLFSSDGSGNTYGTVLVHALRVQMHAQPRNLVGASLTRSDGPQPGELQLTTLQSSAADVPSGHFRLLLVNSAFGLPTATVSANGNVPLLDVEPGGMATIDHVLIEPHAHEQVLMLGFRSSDAVTGATTSGLLVDLSTLCDQAAYAVVFTGTAEFTDSYDPMVMQVDGNADKCSLPTVAVDTGASAPLAFVNAHPSGCPVIFEWGASVLTLSRRTRLLAFGDHELTDAPLGDLYVRLVLGEPPYEPLSEPMRVTVAPQPRNLLVAFAAREALCARPWALRVCRLACCPRGPRGAGLAPRCIASTTTASGMTVAPGMRRSCSSR